ncbi:MAG: DUF1611 domain-containing protein [Planctomycetales bacterium]|nr:DUF1611 domain-containing protein [Planctomycetales bacterium]
MVVLTEGATEPVGAKTATSVIRYRSDEVLAVLDSTQAGRTADELLGVGKGIPIVASLDDVPQANTLLIGIAPSGGRIPAPWRAVILEAIRRGMNVVSGLHEFLSSDPEFSAAAAEHQVQLFDVRKNNERDCAQRQGIREDCLRIHAVGHDCCVGKMVVAIEVAKGLQRRGHDTKFVATGQTGIMIEGDGCPVDCVVSDFVNGAAEKLVLANQQHDILLIEGQGSLAHPKYSAVTLGLLHGCMPQGMIFCYEVGRTHHHGMEYMPIAPMDQIMRACETMANLMYPSKIIGIAMNSRRVSATEADDERRRMRDKYELPVCDVFRHGADDLVAAVEKLKSELIR